MKLSSKITKIVTLIICTLTIIALLPMNTYAKETKPKDRITSKFLNSVDTWDGLVNKTNKLENKITTKAKVDSIDEAFAKGTVSEDDNYYFALIHSINADYNNRKSFPFTNFAEIVAPCSLSSKQVKNIKRIIKLLNNSLDSSVPKGVNLKYDTFYDNKNGYDSYAIATRDFWKITKAYYCIGDQVSFDGFELKYYESPSNGGSGRYGVISSNNPYLKNTSLEQTVKYWDGSTDKYTIPYTAYINGYAYLDKSGKVLESHSIPYNKISDNKTEIKRRSSHTNTLMLLVSTKDSGLGWIDSKYVNRLNKWVSRGTLIEVPLFILPKVI